MKATIREVKARQILDSRGYPTVEAEVLLSDGNRGRASVPSGESRGIHEALALRDNDPSRFDGRGVTKAVANVNDRIADELVGFPATDQTLLDRQLCQFDGTPDKRNLGANAILAVSMAVCAAGANAASLPLYRYLGGVSARVLPVPMMNFLNGGRHAGNGVEIQEFMVAPVDFSSFSEALEAGCVIYYRLREILKNRGLSTSVGDEGGFAPNLRECREGLDLLVSATEAAGFRPGRDVFFALDVASSGFYADGKYRFAGKERSSGEMVDLYADWVRNYPILSIEDGCAEEDWDGWRLLTDRIGESVQLVGDDLFVTNAKRLRRGLLEGVANAILIKPNQIGTVSETIDAVRLAQRSGYATIVSHRSGETEGTFIADLAVGLNAGQIKIGAVSRSERTAKYNRLLRIEEELGPTAIYGGTFFKKEP